jgi:hypothetical protein
MDSSKDYDIDQEYHTRPRSLSGYTAPMLRRRYLYASCASLTAISLFGLLFFTLWAEQPRVDPIVEEISQLNMSFLPVIDPLGPGNNLIGPPTSRFRGPPYTQLSFSL